jgi:hypothetical protein
MKLIKIYSIYTNFKLFILFILHAKTIKSKSALNLWTYISGSAITTFGFPPYFVDFASMSPIVLETDNFPGKTLQGGYIEIPAKL